MTIPEPQLILTPTMCLASSSSIPTNKLSSHKPSMRSRRTLTNHNSSNPSMTSSSNPTKHSNSHPSMPSTSNPTRHSSSKHNPHCIKQLISLHSSSSRVSSSSHHSKHTPNHPIIPRPFQIMIPLFLRMPDPSLTQCTQTYPQHQLHRPLHTKICLGVLTLCTQHSQAPAGQVVQAQTSMFSSQHSHMYQPGNNSNRVKKDTVTVIRNHGRLSQTQYKLIFYRLDILVEYIL